MLFYIVVRPFFLTRTRNSNSRYESSVMQLAADIGLVHREENLDLSISQYRLASIQSRILLGSYTLSLLRVHFVDRGEIKDFFIENLLDYPDIIMERSTPYKLFCVVTPGKKDDALVILGLSVLLLRLSHGTLPKDSLKLEDQLSSFYESLKQMGKVVGKVNRVYQLDLQPSLRTIPVRVVEEKILNLVGDSYVNNLLWPFLNGSIMDDHFDRKGPMGLCGIPSVGEISKVLLKMTLRETFDR